MRHVLRIVLMIWLFSSFSLGATIGKVSGSSEHEVPSWFKQSFLDISEDVDDATAKNKHLMLFIDLDGCPYCTKMLQESFVTANATSQYIKKHFEVINLNVKGDRELTWQGKSMSEKAFAIDLNIQYSPTILFLDENKKVVLKLNGYRTPEKFKTILEYINGKYYKTLSLTEYMQSNSAKEITDKSYSKKANAKIQDLSNIATPLAIIFEEKNSKSCTYFNTVTMKNKEVKKELSKFTVVRFDANSNEEFIGVDGVKTTPKDFVKSINLDYRPGVLLYDNKKLVATQDALLYSFHFKELLRFVSAKEYRYFDTYLSYLNVRQKELVEAGVNIDISK